MGYSLSGSAGSSAWTGAAGAASAQRGELPQVSIGIGGWSAKKGKR